MRSSSRRWVEKIISSEDLTDQKIEEIASKELSHVTLDVIRKSEEPSLQPLLDPNPAVRKAHMEKLLRQYWGLPPKEANASPRGGQ